jgi:hypothetical protein
MQRYLECAPPLPFEGAVSVAFDQGPEYIEQSYMRSASAACRKGRDQQTSRKQIA